MNIFYVIQLSFPDVPSARRSVTPTLAQMSKSTSLSSFKDDDAMSTSTITIHTLQDTADLTPVQLLGIGRCHILHATYTTKVLILVYSVDLVKPQQSTMYQQL